MMRQPPLLSSPHLCLILYEKESVHYGGMKELLLDWTHKECDNC